MKNLIKNAFYFLASNIVLTLSGFMTMSLMANEGQNVLASGALIFSTLGLIMTGVVSIMIPINIYVGISLGSQDIINIQTLIRSSIQLGVMLVLFFLPIFWFSETIFVFLHQPLEIAHLAGGYLRILSIGLIPLFIGLGLSQVLNGLQKTKWTAIINTIWAIIGLSNSYLLLLFIHKHTNISEAKIVLQRLALLNGLTNWGLFISLLYALNTILKSEFKIETSFQFRQNLKQLLLVDYKNLKDIINLGTPILMAQWVEMGALSSMTYMIGHLGVMELAAQNIQMQCAFLFLMIPMSIGQAASILLGQHFGSKNFDGIKNTSKDALLLTFLVCIPIALIYIITPEFLIHFFIISGKEPPSLQFLNIAKHLLLTGALFFILDSFRSVSGSLLRGIRDTKTPLLWCTVGYWFVGLPLAWVLGVNVHFGLDGIRWGFLSGILLSTLMIVIRVFRKAIKYPY